jgi:hypothetical protein
LFLLKELALFIELEVVFSGVMTFEASLGVVFSGVMTFEASLGVVFSGVMTFEASLEGGLTLLMLSVQSWGEPTIVLVIMLAMQSVV